MPFNLLTQLKHKAADMHCNTLLYNWSLGSGTKPERLLVKPVDIWTGSPENGHNILRNIFVYGEEQATIHNHCWQPAGTSQAWNTYVHSFAWLRDLQVTGHPDAPEKARKLISSWVGRYYAWDANTWRSDILGQRLAAWISYYDSFAHDYAAQTHSALTGNLIKLNDFQDVFFDSLLRQANHLSRHPLRDVSGLAALESLKGLIYAGLALEGKENWVSKGLDLLSKQVDKQILSDGGHVTRSPQNLLKAMQILLDIRSALIAGGFPAPINVENAMERACTALRYFRFHDKGFTLFGGSQEGDSEFIDTVLNQASCHTRKKVSVSMIGSGYERVNLGRTQIIFDTGKVPEWPHDKAAPASALAFEMTYGKERVFVNCGSHPYDPEWQDALRFTPAFTTLTLDNRNSSEIKSTGHFGRKTRSVKAFREDTKNGCLIESAHDGYMPLNGVMHKRRLYVCKNGDDIRGEDTLSCAVGLSRELNMAIRFHIHPRVVVSLVKNGTEALLRMPGSGAGWRFYHAGGNLKLEDSIYLGTGTQPRKTKQLVIYSAMKKDNEQFRWTLKRT